MLDDDAPAALRRRIFMRKRTRKLIGTVIILLVVIVYGPLAMALADSRIALAPQALQVLAYAFLGLAWIVPLMPVIKWMEKPDPPAPF
jgi:hypothetical protein